MLFCQPQEFETRAQSGQMKYLGVTIAFIDQVFPEFKMMDDIDREILELLQADATHSLATIAARVNLSSTPCWRRIQRLEKQGIIKRKVAILDAEKLNVNVTVFVLVKTSKHNQDWYQKFYETVSNIPEVVDFYRMSGNIDYLLRVVVPDIAAYDGVYKKLTSNIDIFDVNSSFAMEEIKHTTALPVAYAV